MNVARDITPRDHANIKIYSPKSKSQNSTKIFFPFDFFLSYAIFIPRKIF